MKICNSWNFAIVHSYFLYEVGFWSLAYVSTQLFASFVHILELGYVYTWKSDWCAFSINKSFVQWSVCKIARNTLMLLVLRIIIFRELHVKVNSPKQQNYQRNIPCKWCSHVWDMQVLLIFVAEFYRCQQKSE